MENQIKVIQSYDNHQTTGIQKQIIRTALSQKQELKEKILAKFRGQINRLRT